jgi:hypothetical protein
LVPHCKARTLLSNTCPQWCFETFCCSYITTTTATRWIYRADCHRRQTLATTSPFQEERTDLSTNHPDATRASNAMLIAALALLCAHRAQTDWLHCQANCIYRSVLKTLAQTNETIFIT